MRDSFNARGGRKTRARSGKDVPTMTMVVLSFYCNFPKSDIIYIHENRPHSLAFRDEPCLERANASREGRGDVIVSRIWQWRTKT